MAKRIRRVEHSEEVRERIRTSQLINRLENHAFGEVEMTPTQVQAARVVLSKSLPDLQSTELTGAGGGPIVLTSVSGDESL